MAARGATRGARHHYSPKDARAHQALGATRQARADIHDIVAATPHLVPHGYMSGAESWNVKDWSCRLHTTSDAISSVWPKRRAFVLSNGSFRRKDFLTCAGPPTREEAFAVKLPS